MATFGLERFTEFDNAIGVAAIPTTSTPVTPPLPQLNNTDIIYSWDFFFQLKGTFNAYTGTNTLSPYFPYNFVQNIKVPYQSNSVAAVNMPGQLAQLISVLRKNNVPYQNPTTLGDQKFVLSTGYTPAAQQGSSPSYTVAPSTAETYQFRLRVPVALWFDRFYDTDAKGNLGAIDNTYVSPLFMQSIGRNVTPVIQLNPVNGSRVDRSPFVQTGTLTTLSTWTDNGSNITIRRNGYRQPGAGSANPPAFNWAYNWTVDQLNLQTAKATYTFPLNGQLLCVIFMLFDPTLNSGIGGPIPLANINDVQLKYGAGIVKYDDNPISLQDRMMDQHGIDLTEGIGFYDLYIDTRTNLDAINTYNTAAVQLKFDFGTNTPGTGSFVLVAAEWLTAVG